MLRRSPIGLSGEGRAAAPSVGIFFGAMHHGVPVILHEATALAEAEDYGLCKTHPGGHLEAWEASRMTLSLQGDYDDFPRGRIVYDRHSRCFNVYLDRTLDVPAFRCVITHYFALPYGFTVFHYDAHYARARHKMVFELD
jgi:hypothetical protein